MDPAVMHNLLNAAIQILQDHINVPIPALLQEDDNNSSADDSEDEGMFLPAIDREEHVQMKDFVVNVVYHLTDEDFRSHFRLSRTGMEELYNELQLSFTQITGRPQIPVTDGLLLAVWVLATPEAFRSVANRFGLDRGNAHVICMKVYQTMYEKSNVWIRWPRGEEAVRCVEDFSSHGFPGVFGAVDGSYIPIPGPLRDNSYYNRKGFHSITLQGVCDSHMRFIDIFIGFPSSAHDARVWANSPLGQALLENPAAHLPPGCHLLGDKAYPCRIYLITPFKDNGHLTPQMIQFNTKLSKIRVVIENAFGRLKGIFRRMKFLNITNLNYARHYIAASCILHNIVINERFKLGDVDFDVDDDNNNDEAEDEEGEDDDEENEDVIDEVAEQIVVQGAVENETGLQKRRRLMNLIVPL